MTAVSCDPKDGGVSVKKYIVPVMSGIMIVLGAAYPILTLGCFALNIVYVLLTQAKDAFRLLFVLLPFAQIYKVLAFGGTSFFTYLELFVAVLYIFKLGKIKRKFLILFLAWTGYVFLGCSLDITMWIKQLLIPLIIYIFFHSERLSFKEIVISLTIGLVLSSVFALLKDQIPGLSAMIRTTRVWEADALVYRFSGTYPDPNYYTLVIILCAISLLIMYAYQHMGWEAIAWFLVLVFFGTQTASKSFILMLAVVAVLFVVSMFANKRYKAGLAFLVLLGIGAIIILMGKIPLFENVLLRLRSGSGDFLTGRSDTWKQYFSYFENNLPKVLVGSGINAAYLHGLAAHNTYIDLLYYHGVCGTVILFSACLSAAQMHRMHRSIVNYMPLLCLLILNMFLSCVTFFDFKFMLILVLYALQKDFGVPHWNNGKNQQIISTDS